MTNCKRVLLLVALVAALARATATNPQVSTKSGPIYGFLNEQGSYSFKGVPFAAPPVGNLRFMPPVPPNNWTTPLNATGFAPGCYSHCNGNARLRDLMCTATVSEDCLYLNVYTPSLSPEANLPVIFFIHGGMFDWGSGGIPLYEGNLWVKEQNIVLVTINYRLNIFGGLYTGTGVGGNFHIQDQRMALKWVNENIANFGGDPTRVVLSGQSAGATSVGIHLVTPASWPYFQRAAIISDPYGLIPLDTKIAGELGGLIVDELGCSSATPAAELACLQNKTVEEIFAKSKTEILPTPNEVLAMFMPWTPTVDGVILTEQPIDAVAAGRSSPVPLYIGTVANETIPFIFGINFNTSAFLMDVALDYVFGIDKGTAIADLYGPVPADQSGDTRPFFSMIFTDYSFYCPSRFVARSQSKVNGNRTFMYFFDEHPSWSLWYAANNTHDPCVEYICHAFDLPYVFDTYYKLPAGAPTFTPEEQTMTRYIQNSLTEFASTGVISNWPAFTDKQRIARNYSVPIATSGWLVDYRQEYCDYFDSIGYDRW